MDYQLKVWITGSDGQIGTALNEMINPLEVEALNTDRDEVDVSNMDEVLSFGEIQRPDVIINCAGISDAAECEKNPELAYKVNGLGARNLSIVAGKIGAVMVQISTDDVFDGKSQKPYCEFDDTNPRTVYGRSKRAGENYVKEFTNKHFIVRSNWIYGVKGNNFVYNILRKAAKGKVIPVAADQSGSPTSANALAGFLLHLIRTNEYGTYHATCKGVCDRYDFAGEILRVTGVEGTLRAVTTAESEFSKGRPEYAVLDNMVMRILGDYEMPEWKEALREYVAEHELKGGLDG